MTGIKKTEYITIKKRNMFGKVDIFVGGKPVTVYRDEKISDVDLVKKWFKSIQRQYSIKELRIMTSETPGEYGTYGDPVATPGKSAWCRVKYRWGVLGPWTSLGADGYRNAGTCAYWATYYYNNYGCRLIPDSLELIEYKIKKLHDKIVVFLSR